MSEAAVSPGFSRLLSDERLTRRAVSGDERAFAAIFRRYHQSLYRFCLAIVGNPEDAQDALQNTMMKVLRALPGEEREIELKPWLYRIAHNESIDLLRRRRETRELSVEQAAPGYALAEDAETRERLRRLLADLRELPERQREVLVMRELAGLDFEEIGAALSTSGAVARQTLYEARQSLRQMEEGREMNCEAVMKALSDGDGRVARRRDVRAHLRSCAGCSSFREEIKARQHDLAALSPLPAVAAAGILQGLIGGSQAAGGGGLAAALGGGAAQGIGASAAAKGVATVAVAAAVGVTAADRTGVIHIGPPGGGGAKTSEPVPGNPGPSGEPARGGAVGDDRDSRDRHPAGSAGDKAETEGRGVAGDDAVSHGAAENEVADHGGHAEPPAEAKGHGLGVEHAGERGHEAQHPPAAAEGQETAEANKPTVPGEPPAADGEPAVEPPKPPKPPKSAPAPSPSPGEAPGGPPAGAPAPPPPADPKAPGQTQTPPAPSTAPESPPEAGNGKGKGKGNGNGP